MVAIAELGRAYQNQAVEQARPALDAKERHGDGAGAAAHWRAPSEMGDGDEWGEFRSWTRPTSRSRRPAGATSATLRVWASVATTARSTSSRSRSPIRIRASGRVLFGSGRLAAWVFDRLGLEHLSPGEGKLG